jgi:plasmid stabilization system protein ParE
MIERVIYTPEAEQDVTDAYSWYEAREPGLGEDFLRCVEACVLAIQRHPQLYPIAVDEFRRGLVRRFPFEVFYEATGDRMEGSMIKRRGFLKSLRHSQGGGLGGLSPGYLLAAPSGRESGADDWFF